MLTAVLVVVGIIAAWLLVDRLLIARDERLRRGAAAWTEPGSSRTFHSTGWEDTVPPLEPIDVRLARLRQRPSKEAAA